MGRHTKPHQPDDEGAPEPPASPAQHRPGGSSTLSDTASASSDDPSVTRADLPVMRPSPSPAPPPVPSATPPAPPVSLDLTMPDVSAFYKTRGPEPGPATDRPSAPGRPPATGRPGAAAPAAGAAVSPPTPPRRDPEKADKAEGSDKAESGGAKPPWLRWSKKVVITPLLPVTALVIAVGIVAYAGSTSQISLNFGGGAHETVERGGGGDEVTERQPKTRGAGSDGLVVAFRLASRTQTGFRGTVTIANRGGKSVADWAIAFRIPGVTFSGATGGTVVRTGQTLYVRKAPAGPALAPGQKVQIVYTATGTAQPTSICRINRAPCVQV